MFNEAWINRCLSTISFAHFRDRRGVFTVISCEFSETFAQGNSLDEAVSNLQRCLRKHVPFRHKMIFG
jgi:hypothetical protein